MKSNFIFQFIFIGMTCLFGCVPRAYAIESSPHSAGGNNTMTKAIQTSLTPQQALAYLKAGNQRFVSGNMENQNWLAQVKQTAAGQYPLAVVLNCMDSRTPPEIIFDQGLGDIFTIRVAGNIQNPDILGSMEFGTQQMGAKLIAVIGHTSCGAMRGACKQTHLGHLTGLLNKIQPAVNQAAKIAKTHDCNQATYIDEIAKDNVLLVIKQIQARSPTIKKLMQEGKVNIIGGMQDLNTGKVTFFE